VHRVVPALGLQVDHVQTEFVFLDDAVVDGLLRRAPGFLATESGPSELMQSLADELLTQVRAASPSFFERLVVDLMLAIELGRHRCSLRADFFADSGYGSKPCHERVSNVSDVGILEEIADLYAVMCDPFLPGSGAKRLQAS